MACYPRLPGAPEEGPGEVAGTPLCRTCREDLEPDVVALRAQVRGALRSIIRGGAAGLVLPHFNDALQGLGCLAGYQRMGALVAPPDVDTLRQRLAEARYEALSGAIASRTAAMHQESDPLASLAPAAGSAWQGAIGEVLEQLGALHLARCGEQPDPGGASPDPPTVPGSPTTFVEQRRRSRVSLRYPVLVSPGDLGGIAVDLSAEGAGFRLDRSLAEGSRVWLTFCRRCRLEVEGEVRWSAGSAVGGPPAAAEPTAGVRFCAPMPDHALRGVLAVAAPS